MSNFLCQNGAFFRVSDQWRHLPTSRCKFHLSLTIVFVKQDKETQKTLNADKGLLAEERELKKTPIKKDILKMYLKKFPNVGETQNFNL